jgi:dCTP deaminase
MILSDKEIVAAREAGDIIIEPFDKRNLGSDTYDVRLGEFYYREKEPDLRASDVILGEPACWLFGFLMKAIALRTGRSFIQINPGETILAHTQEFIGGVRGVTTKMFSRSSIGRSLLGVCKCAGRGDVGYFNRWTMEITSFSRHHVLWLPVGMRIAQIEFIRTGEVEQVYGRDRGKYQQGCDIEELKRNWKPEMMLPHLEKDWENA